MKRVVIVLILIGMAVLLSKCNNLATRFKHPFVQTQQIAVTPTPTPLPLPSPEATPWPTPVEITVYLWFNYKYQKADQSEYLFFYSFTPKKAEDSEMLVKCKLNKEYVEALIKKEAVTEIEVSYSKCRRLDP